MGRIPPLPLAYPRLGQAAGEGTGGEVKQAQDRTTAFT
jgi:hypothetical protein